MQWCFYVVKNLIRGSAFLLVGHVFSTFPLKMFALYNSWLHPFFVFKLAISELTIFFPLFCCKLFFLMPTCCPIFSIIGIYTICSLLPLNVKDLCLGRLKTWVYLFIYFFYKALRDRDNFFWLGPIKETKN